MLTDLVKMFNSSNIWQSEQKKNKFIQKMTLQVVLRIFFWYISMLTPFLK